jgi:hypothetical protein
MSQTLLTNKKQGNPGLSTLRKKHYKGPYLGLELTICTCHQKPNPSRETAPLRCQHYCSTFSSVFSMGKIRENVTTSPLDQ